ncbi:MAG: hypothetical protein IIA87_04425 [Nanoarchaeota archaeon]|nr:hypothetical protein [Nanoarchaeota archaeon]
MIELTDSSTAEVGNSFIEQGTFFAELSDSQKAAIRFSLQLGMEVQKAFPDIAENYRNGMSHSKLVETHDIQGTFGVSKSTAMEAVRRAIVGYDGSIDIARDVPPYVGLITDSSELEKIAREHSVEAGKRLGRFVWIRGLFCLDKILQR